MLFKRKLLLIVLLLLLLVLLWPKERAEAFKKDPEQMQVCCIIGGFVYISKSAENTRDQREAMSPTI